MAEMKPPLSELENQVMQVIWDKGSVTTEAVRDTLIKTNPMKDSTARTILRRLETKGYVDHTVEGRTFIYSPRTQAHHVASDAVSGIIEKFCNGSVENLLIGMVNNKLLTPAKLKALAKKIEDAERADAARSTKAKSGKRKGDSK